MSAHKALSGANTVVNATATTVADVFPQRFANVTVSTCGGGSAAATSEHKCTCIQDVLKPSFNLKSHLTIEKRGCLFVLTAFRPNNS